MSYPQAAGSSSGSGQGSHQNPKDRFSNAKMIVCMANGFSYEQLADELHKNGYWKSVSSFQKVDFSLRIAIVMEDAALRDKLVEEGLNIDGKHVMFAHHRRRCNTRAYVSQLPIGINEIDFREVFSFYGELLEINYVTKLMYGRRIDTGDRVLIFRKINRHIPSYTFVRGWRAFVKYNGQQQTCRVCGSTTHFAKDCPVNKKDKRESENKEPESPVDPPTSMDINVILPHEGFQTRSKQEIKQLYQDCFGSAGSSLTGDREDDSSGELRPGSDHSKSVEPENY